MAASVADGAAERLHFDDYFVRGELIGTGITGKVFSCTLKPGVAHPFGALPTSLCVKTYNVRGAAQSATKLLTMIEREYSALIRMRHPYILRIVHVFKEFDEIDDTELTGVDVVLERAVPVPDNGALDSVPVAQRIQLYGGPSELFRYIVMRGALSEAQARFAMYQMLAAIHALHSLKPEPIVHRDLKPENVLYWGTRDTSAGAVPLCKLADFGTARTVPVGEVAFMTMAGIGSGQFIAPEFFNKTPYDMSVDIYSLGVTLFVLTTLSHPHTNPGESEAIAFWRGRKLRGEVRWPAVDAVLGAEGRALLRSMMAPEGKDRPTSEACLRHPWFDPIRDEVAAVFGDDLLQRLRGPAGGAAGGAGAI